MARAAKWGRRPGYLLSTTLPFDVFHIIHASAMFFMSIYPVHHVHKVDHLLSNILNFIP
jgi:hypothetical protein